MEWNESPLDKLADAGTAGALFSLAWLIPRIDAALTHKDKVRVYEDIVGETDENKSKLSTTIVSATEIGDHPSLTSTLANFLLWVRIIVDLEKGTPIVYRGIELLLRSLCRIAFKRRLAALDKYQQLVTIYYAFNAADRFIRSLFKGAIKPAHTRAMMDANWAKVDTDIITRALHQLQDDIRRLNNFADVGELLPECLIFVNSQARKQLKDEEDRAAFARLSKESGSKRSGSALGNSTSKKQQTTIQGATNRAENKAGDIIFASNAVRMPMPPQLLSRDKKPCGPFYRDGKSCKWGPRCNFDHTPIDRLSAADKKIWADFVGSTPSLSFNTSRVRTITATAAAAADTSAQQQAAGTSTSESG